MELYRVRVVKKDTGRTYFDMYLGWYYKRARYERVSPTFKGFSLKILLARSIEVKNVKEMIEAINRENDMLAH